MGLFDEWINGLRFATGAARKAQKEYYDTNEGKFCDDIPEGEAFVFVTSDRFIEPFKNDSFDFTDFLRGGIQGVSKSYWIHAGVGLKLNGRIRIIESLDKVKESDLSVYFHPQNQMKLFFPPITKDQSLEVWRRAKSKFGMEYDYGEIFDHISILRKIFGIRFGDMKKFVCSSLVRWVFKPFYDVCNPKIKEHTCKPSEINYWMNKDMKCKLMVYNLNPYKAN